MSYLNLSNLSYLGLVLISFILFSSCNDTVGTEEAQKNYDLKENLTIENNQDLFSQEFVSLGVVKAEVKKRKSRTDINFLQHNVISGDKHNSREQSFSFYIKDEVLHLDGKPSLGVSLVNNSPYIITENYQGPLEDFSKNNLNKDLTLLLFALDEITSNSQNKIKANMFHRSTLSGCSFWNTYYLNSVGFTRSVAVSTIKSEGASRKVKDHEEATGETCSKIGGVDTSCVGENHGCLSTQAYCCK
ncbi:hypothetical protein [Fodinibius halophilus]|uniref:Uncharacterized protein n=1 Tax=Fodinibius halophilus TaxID=1736908 RepID=A0A6M1T4C3_9BACT|nr:hypothetical protein [Fodinibius halophilus]NGP87513.1 hypothetical protein [Fodinibius halophilus]